MSKKGKERKEDYKWQLKSQYKGEPIAGDIIVNIILYFDNKRVHDWDNYHKASMDACSGIVWEDDVQIQEAHVFKEYDKDNPRIEIYVL
jgi:Holliday junction resolvase RusA-like endonuclease